MTAASCPSPCRRRNRGYADNLAVVTRRHGDRSRDHAVAVVAAAVVKTTLQAALALNTRAGLVR